MLDYTTVTLNACADERNAVVAFSTYNLEITAGICAAAERTGRPVIVQAGSSAFAYAGRSILAAATLAAARASTALIGVHLDHCRNLDELTYCVNAGYTSVMIDGSHLDFEANIELTRRAVRIAHDAGVWVEAELGALSGDEDRSGTAAASASMTAPEAVAEFVERTKVDCLAVAVGNVHGFSDQPAVLDLDRLASIRDASPVPLVLHGASGLPDAQLRSAVTNGVAKINVNTELRAAFLTAIKPAKLSDQEAFAIADHLGPARAAVEAAAIAKIKEMMPTQSQSDRLTN